VSVSLPPAHPGCVPKRHRRQVNLQPREFIGNFSVSVIAAPGGSLGRQVRDGTPSADGVGQAGSGVAAPQTGRAAPRAEAPQQVRQQRPHGDRTRRPRTACLLGHPQGRQPGPN
jgi:hypothetical protein